MLHAYDQRFDVTGNLENFCELNNALKSKQINGPGRVHSNRRSPVTRALFSSNFFFKTGTVALSFVCDKYCLIMD